MKKAILIFICSILVLFTGCVHDDTGRDNLNETIIFNKCDDYYVVGRHLVDPVLVTENEFCDRYDIDINSITESYNSEVQFCLEYILDQNTLKPDLSKLSNGVITVSESGSVVFVMCISEIQPVEYYTVNCQDIEKSSVENVDVELFNLSKESSALLYGKFTYDKYFITCYMYTEAEGKFAEILSSFVANNTSNVE